MHGSSALKTQNELTNVQTRLPLYQFERIDGLMQERRNLSVLAMEWRLSCINPSDWSIWSAIRAPMVSENVPPIDMYILLS